MTRKYLVILTSVLFALLLTFNGGDVQANDTTTLQLTFDGLPNLGAHFAYEGWLIVGGAPVSTGTFTVDDNGTANQSTFEVAQAAADKASTFVLTIEPNPDSDPAPAATHVLAGDFANAAAKLSVAHPAALGTDFSAAGGGYILAAPSAEAGTATYRNGLWYLDPMAGPGPALNLPVLPDGWAYEGWVVNADGPISTGTFVDVAAADSDGGGTTAGPNATPPFPGQDFVNPLRDLLAGYTVVISVEPSPDNSPAPFAFKPLVDVNIDDVRGPGGFQRFQAPNLASLASGTATFGSGTDSSDEASMPPAPPADNIIVFSTPVGASGPGPLLPGGAYEFSFRASQGERLSFATMLVQSNDFFYAPNEWGIALYDADGTPRSGDVTDSVHLWDAGTEADEMPGVGPNQAPRQAAANRGPVDSNRMVRRAHDNYGIIPAVNAVIRVMLTHTGGDTFMLRIDNVSASSSFATPLAPGLAVVTRDYAPLFQTGFYDRNLGLEAIAEDGDPSILAANLRAQ